MAISRLYSERKLLRGFEIAAFIACSRIVVIDLLT